MLRLSIWRRTNSSYIYPTTKSFCNFLGFVLEFFTTATRDSKMITAANFSPFVFLFNQASLHLKRNADVWGKTKRTASVQDLITSKSSPSLNHLSCYHSSGNIPRLRGQTSRNPARLCRAHHERLFKFVNLLDFGVGFFFGLHDLATVVNTTKPTTHTGS